MTTALLDRPVNDLNRRRMLGGTALAALLAACGTSGPAPSAGAPGYPREVAHAGGTVTIPDRPVRVLSEFNGYEFDALLALGVPVTGRGEASGNALFPWQRAAGGADVPVLPFYGGNLEEFTRADPDVLFMTDLNYGDGSGPPADYARVAPVVAIPGGIEEPLRIVAEVMGLAPDVLDEVLAGVESRFGAFVPARVPASVVAFYYYGDGQLYLATDRNPLSRLLERVGLPALTAPPGDAGSPGLATVSAERADLLEADLLIGLLDGDFAAELDALESDPLFAALDVVRRGDFVRPSTDDGRALTRPTALSLPTALDALDRVLRA